MADAGAARDVALTMVRAYLDKSRENATEGRALIDRAVSLQSAAFDLLPVGVHLQFDTDLWVVVVEKQTDGGWLSVGGADMVTADVEWVRENWERGNWKIVDEEKADG